MNGRISRDEERRDNSDRPYSLAGQPWIDNLLLQFTNTTQYAKVLVNDEPSPVEVKYSGANIELRNLREFPPFISLEQQTPSTEVNLEDPFETSKAEPYNTVKSSEDGHNWYTVTDTEASEELQVYFLYNPSFVLPFTTWPNYVTATVEGTYSIDSLPFPKRVKNFFTENGETERRIRIIHHNNRLIKMIQKDFPPFTDSITLEFSPQ